MSNSMLTVKNGGSWTNLWLLFCLGLWMLLAITETEIFQSCVSMVLAGDSQIRVLCTNIIHDLGSAEPRWKVEPSSRWITLHQVELGSADPVQLNGRGYTMDDSDRSTTLGIWPTTVTSQSNSMLTKHSSTDWLWFVRILSFFEVTTQFLHQRCIDKVLKIRILCSNRYLLIILRLLSRYLFTVTTA